ncbi:putative toxin-antitoxin system toxin component, PIN family [bacterium]|nr:putative toxin-antitoxin system toxin component, PIN family [bacterium]MBU1957649.1 putative toxin-antitoxin system toxin component, PIN family [bacterium]
MKIVMDTDVFLSSLFSKQGASHRLVTWIVKQYKNSNKQYNVISNTQVIEFLAVLTRDKNLKRANLNKDDVETFIDGICLISFHQKINFLWRPFLRDKDDDMVLEVAFNAKADYIVTHNIKDFEGVEDKFEIKVLTPKEFLLTIGELK